MISRKLSWPTFQPYYVASTTSVYGCAQTDWNWTLRKLSSPVVAHVAKVDATGFMVNGSAVTLLPTVTCLGVVVDQEMLFADHVRRLASLCFYWLNALLQLRFEYDSSAIRARFDYEAYEMPTIRVRYNILQHPTRSLRGVMRFRAIMNMSILLRCCTVL